MSLAQQRMVTRAVRHFGDGRVITLRKRNALRDQVRGVAATALQLDGNAALGASTVNLKGSGLDGKLIAGMRLQIAGDSTIYATTNTVSVAGGGLSGVALSPALAQAVASGTAVTITQPYVDAEFHSASNINLTEEERTTLVAKGLSRYFVSAEEGGGAVPEPKDLILETGESIGKVRPIGSGATVGWAIDAGEAASA